MSNYFVGVDVGTGSVRAALVTENGKVVEIAEQETKTWNPKPDFYEQSSEDIWAATIRCVKVRTKIYSQIMLSNTVCLNGLRLKRTTGNCKKYYCLLITFTIKNKPSIL